MTTREIAPWQKNNEVDLVSELNCIHIIDFNKDERNPQKRVLPHECIVNILPPPSNYIPGHKNNEVAMATSQNILHTNIVPEVVVSRDISAPQDSKLGTKKSNCVRGCLAALPNVS